MQALQQQQELKKRIRAGRPVVGLFVRTPAMQVVEALGQCGFDFLALDAEHAAFGIRELDQCLLAARSVGVPALVRLADPSPASILRVLDMGAAGIIAPHISSKEAAQRVCAACRYRGGSRGFSAQHRAAAYGGIPATRYRAASDESIIVIAQIEDRAGANNVSDIAAVPELDALFVGRADLAISLGCDSIDDAAVAETTEQILSAGRSGGKTTGIYLNTTDETGKFRNAGASLFIISTEQLLLVNAASGIAAQFRQEVAQDT